MLFKSLLRHCSYPRLYLYLKPKTSTLEAMFFKEIIENMKYLSKQITLQEVPNEISLSYLITGCPWRCKGCHSPEARDWSLGKELTVEALASHLRESKGITCVCFLGGDWWNNTLVPLLKYIKGKWLKTCLYSWAYFIHDKFRDYLDYAKEWPYIEEFGGLNNPNTNQRFYRLDTMELMNNYFLKK